MAAPFGPELFCRNRSLLGTFGRLTLELRIQLPTYRTAIELKYSHRKPGEYAAVRSRAIDYDGGMDLVREFLRHNTTTNEWLLEACRPLSPEQLAATVTGTFGSIGATLVHIANAQVGYAARILGTERPEPLDEEPFPGFDALSERFSTGNANLEKAAVYPDRDRDVEVIGDEDDRWRLPASLILLQAVNHGTEHRSQISTILTQIGVEPPEMDGWTFFGMTRRMVRV